MIVIADTSPINYLVLIDEIEILPKLFHEVFIPFGVLVELERDQTPEKVRKWVMSNPLWLKVEMVTVGSDGSLAKLGRGEHEAISLAERHNADLLIIDDLAGRKEAVKRGLRAVGTLFLLQSASRKGLLDLPVALEKLKQTNFRISLKILESLIDEENIFE